MVINWEIRFGDMLTVVTLVGGMVALIYRIGTHGGTMKALQEDVRELKETQKEMATALTQMAVQQIRLESHGMRLDTLDRRYEELRHGQGFTFPKVGQLPSG